MTVPVVTPTVGINTMYAGMTIFGATTSVMTGVATIKNGENEYRVKVADMDANTAGMIHPPPITGH